MKHKWYQAEYWFSPLWQRLLNWVVMINGVWFFAELIWTVIQ